MSKLKALIIIAGANPKTTIKKINKRYYNLANFYKYLYYINRIIAGFCVVLIPILLSTRKEIVTILFILMALIMVLDTVLNPMESWIRYSVSSDMLYVEELKKSGKYEEFEKEIKIITETENELFASLLSLSELIEKLRKNNTTKEPSE
ncbi:MAG: hypothetical protein JW870_12710 [Candidatus Delongbacteria bacterium]|nr:hypothetical protein [Candidatus Delongbacteria bacterium]